MSTERVVCKLNPYTVKTVDPGGSENFEISTGFPDLIVQDYAARGFRVVTPDYFRRRSLRAALQGMRE